MVSVLRCVLPMVAAFSVLGIGWVRVKAADPYLVKDIYTFGTGSGEPLNFCVMGSTLYFTASNFTEGRELWKTDGTASGTVMVKDINSGVGSSNPAYLTVIGSTLYFRATSGTATGYELWKSDGTSSGTVMVKDIFAGGGDSNPSFLVARGSTLYFRAYEGSGGSELWKSDGTSDGTVMVRNIVSGAGSSAPEFLTAASDVVYFQAYDTNTGIWKSDGTSSGTTRIKHIQITETQGRRVTAAIGSKFLFQGYTSAGGHEIWVSDGTETGTVVLKDIAAGGGSSYPTEMTVVGTNVYFSAFEGAVPALWMSDGTVTGTKSVSNLLTPISSLYPTSLTGMGGKLYYSARDAAGQELWVTDGTLAGTKRVKDIRGGNGGSSPTQMVAAGSTLFFSADDGVHGAELWKSDGTAAGTVLVKDIVAGEESSQIEQMKVMGSRLFFTVYTASQGRELWAYDIPPAVTTGGTSALNVASATVHGTVATNGIEATTAQFEYGETPSLGQTVEVELTEEAREEPVAVSASLSGLKPDTDYHFKLSAQNEGNAADGESGVFSTLPDTTAPTGGTAVLAPASSVDASEAVPVSFGGWADDYSMPLTYEVLVNGVAVSPKGAGASREIAAPDEPGAHTVTGRIYDAANNVTEVVTSLTVNTPLQSWRKTHFGSTSNGGSAADSFDFDGDGLANLLEWACKLDPTKASELPVEATVGANSVEFVYTRSKAAVSAGAVFQVRWSDTLAQGSWSSVGVTEQVLSDDGTVQQVKALVPAGTLGRRFMHLHVTAPP